jgi:SHS2 domain-containing protein
LSLEYQIIDHTADLGIVVKAHSLKNLFINSAKVMIDLIIQGDVKGKTEVREILIEGRDYPDLMVRWLGEILYLFYGENILVSSIEIKSLSRNRIKSRIEFVEFDSEYYEILREIKAVTYHRISVEKIDDTWKAMVIFDV